MLLPLLCITAMLALVATGKLLPFSLLIAADAITHSATTAACTKTSWRHCICRLPVSCWQSQFDFPWHRHSLYSEHLFVAMSKPLKCNALMLLPASLCCLLAVAPADCFLTALFSHAVCDSSSCCRDAVAVDLASLCSWCHCYCRSFCCCHRSFLAIHI